MIAQARESVLKTNLEYYLVIKRLPLYYNMKLVTYSIDNDSNLIIQFPVIAQNDNQIPVVLYQRQIVPILILYWNTKADSYTEVQVNIPYNTINNEIYISLRHQELRNCKNLGYDFYWEELFIVMHKSKYNCKTAVFLSF